MKKHLICLAVIFFAANPVYSQKKTMTAPKFSLGIITYSPVNITGAGKFSNDNWILSPSQNRTSDKYGLGLDFKYNISENVSWKTWIGYSKRNISENSSEELYAFINNIPVPTDLTQTASYDQPSFIANSGINFGAKLNKFEINTGFELSYLHTGQGNQTIERIYDLHQDTLPVPDYYKFTDSQTIPSGNSYGVGLFIGGEYNIFKNFSVGAEFHEFLYYSVFSGQTDYVSEFEDGFGNVFSNTSQNPDDFKQFAFSAITPVILIKYKF